MEKSKKYEYGCNMTFKHETPRRWYEYIFWIMYVGGIAISLLLLLFCANHDFDSITFSKYLTLIFIICIITLIGMIGSLITTRIRIRYDFHYTIVLQESSFSIKGGADTPFRAWPRNSTYKFDESKKLVTIADDIGNEMTYYYDEHFKEFLEEIHMN